MTEPNKVKGKNLENAVHAIESALLKSDPNLAEDAFMIETNKFIHNDGSRYEIDIYVTIQLSNGYENIVIFECKNWKDKVSRSEIILFEDKMKLCGASRGFFVARELTKDAESRAAKNEQLEVLEASKLDPASIPMPFDFHVLANEMKKIEIEFFAKGHCSKNDPKPIDLETASATLDGRNLNLIDYVNAWATQAVNRSTLSFPSFELEDDIYSHETDDTRTFDGTEMIVEKTEMEKAELSVKFESRVVRPSIVSAFDIETRGRSLSFASVSLGNGGSIAITLATIDKK